MPQTRTTGAVVTSSFWRTLANVLSMVSLPAGAAVLSSTPTSLYGWGLAAFGFAIQFLKYYADQHSQ